MPYLIYKNRRQANAACAAACNIWAAKGRGRPHKPSVFQIGGGFFMLDVCLLEALELAAEKPQFTITAVEVSPSLRKEILSDSRAEHFSPALVQDMWARVRKGSMKVPAPAKAEKPRAPSEDEQEAVGRLVDKAP